MVTKKQFDSSLISTNILKCSEKLKAKIKWDNSEINDSNLYSFCCLEKMECLCKLNPVSLTYIPILDIRNKIKNVERVGNKKILIELVSEDQLTLTFNEILLFKLLKLKDINYSREDLNFGDLQKEKLLETQAKGASIMVNKIMFRLNNLDSPTKHIFILYFVIGILLILLISK
jgi:hypothetical protein